MISKPVVCVASIKSSTDLDRKPHFQEMSGGASWSGNGHGLADGFTVYLEKPGAGTDQAPTRHSGFNKACGQGLYPASCPKATASGPSARILSMGVCACKFAETKTKLNNLKVLFLIRLLQLITPSTLKLQIFFFSNRICVTSRSV